MPALAGRSWWSGPESDLVHDEQRGPSTELMLVFWPRRRPSVGSAPGMLALKSVARASLYMHDEYVAIRPFLPADAQAVFEAVQESRADVDPWLPDLGATRAISDVQTYIAQQPDAWASGDAYNFVILDHHTDRLLGGCGLTQIDHRHRLANMYYWVRTSHTKRGIATRGVRLLARFGFEALALARIEIVVPVRNTASIRVATKAGASREGILRSRVILHDVLHDAVMFSLVQHDFVE
jgi:ribosomal-protein-serine acetyltransferase